jgi:hypothetical protein
MVWCIIPGLHEGRVLPTNRIFQTSWVTPPPKHANPKIKIRKQQTRKIEKYSRPDAIRAGVLYIVKSYCIVFSNTKYKISKLLIMDLPDSANETEPCWERVKNT